MTRRALGQAAVCKYITCLLYVQYLVVCIQVYRTRKAYACDLMLPHRDGGSSITPCMLEALLCLAYTAGGSVCMHVCITRVCLSCRCLLYSKCFAAGIWAVRAFAKDFESGAVIFVRSALPPSLSFCLSVCLFVCLSLCLSYLSCLFICRLMPVVAF